MSLKELSKEQKQYIVLGCLAAVILVILLVLGIRFSMASVTAAKNELDDLTAKIEQADQALSRSARTSADYAETVSVLREYLENAPPDRNYYSWATEIMYSKARLVGLEIDSIDEITIPQQPVSADDGDGITFDSYSLRIAAHGGYENAKYFLRQLTEDYPLVRFSGIEISAGQSPDDHDIQLFMQWPFNFGEISKNWDAVASKQRKVAESNDTSNLHAASEIAPEPERAVPSKEAPKPAMEPYPPTTRPSVEAQPALKPKAITPAAEVQPSTTAESHAVSQPASNSEIQALLLDGTGLAAASNIEAIPSETVEVAPVTEPAAVLQPEPEPVVVPEPGPEPMMVEEHPEIEPVFESAVEETESSAASAVVPEQPVESVLEPAQLTEPIVEPEPAVVPMVQPEPETSIEDEWLQLNNGFEEEGGISEPEAIQRENAGVVPPEQPASDNEMNEEAEAASVAPPPRTYVATGKSEKILDELLNKRGPASDASLSSFLDGLVGEINEK